MVTGNFVDSFVTPNHLWPVICGNRSRKIWKAIDIAVT